MATTGFIGMMTRKQEDRLHTVLSVAHRDYSKGLNSHSFFRVPDRTMSEDLVQDTFMKTWRYLIRGGKIDVMKAFLYHVLNNLIVDEYRRHRTVSLDGLLENGFEPGVDTTKRLFNFVDGKAALPLIQRLPKKYQRVMRMRYVQDLSLKEMSLITGQSVNTLAVQAHRGLKKLRLLFNAGSAA